ncbi:hypothetical protein ACHAWF_005134 [Thalassiosira exigua]
MLALRNAKFKGDLCRSHVIGTTPAWTRNCFRQRNKLFLSFTPRRPPVEQSTVGNAAMKSRDTNNFGLVVDQIKAFSIGSVAGLLGSLAGMGGGFVMIPMMTAARHAISTSGSRQMFWRGGLGLNQHQAHGTSLFAVGTTGIAGAVGYGFQTSKDDESSRKLVAEEVDTTPATEMTQKTEDRSQNQGLVELDTALALATTAMVTARFGAIASTRLSERALQRALGAFMLFVAPLVPGKAYLEALHDVSDPNNPDVQKHLDSDNESHPNHKHLSRTERLLPASLIGTFSGFLSGMFGVGGGAVVVPSLVLMTDMTHHSALATSLCAMVMPAMVGVHTHSKKGNVNWKVAPMLAAGSAVGAFLGGREVGLNLDEDVLRVGFSCLMLFLGIRTWRKGAK